jgi:hypothetical protein
MSEPAQEAFTEALRAEVNAVVARYHALAVAREEALRAEIERLKAKVLSLGQELSRARAREGELEAAARNAAAASQALEEQFAAEQRFAAACRGLEGSLLGEALKGAVGREIDATPATYAALKGRGLEAVLIAAFRERGRSAAQAPLLERERSSLGALAAAAEGELMTPAAGTKFSASTMDKASTVADPAEEGNVVACLMPGLRRSGTEGALLFPRVVVATG